MSGIGFAISPFAERGTGPVFESNQSTDFLCDRYASGPQKKSRLSNAGLPDEENEVSVLYEARDGEAHQHEEDGW